MAIIEEAHMPLSPEQEALCERLDKGAERCILRLAIFLYWAADIPDV